MPNVPDSLDTPLLEEESDTISGGVVDNAELHLLQPNQAGYLLNLYPTIDGRRQKRQGVDAIGCAGTGNPNSLFPFEAPLAAFRNLVGHWGSALYSTPGNDVLTRRASGVSFCNTRYMAATGRGATNLSTLFMSTCVGVSDNTSLPYGNLVALDRNWAVTEMSAQRWRAIAWYQGRLFGFNSCMTLLGADYFGWSNILDGRNWSNGNNLQIDPDTGDQGMAIVPLRGSTPQLYLFKERSVHLLDIYWSTDGFIPATANSMDTTKTSLRTLTQETGLVGSRAVVWTPGIKGGAGDVLYLSREGIRSMQRTQLDSQGGAGLPLSYRIQTTIDLINWQAAQVAVAETWKGVTYFSVPINGSVYNNFVIAYDSLRDAFFYLDWQVSAWAKCQLTTDRKFFFMGNTSVSELYSAAATLGYHIYETDTGAVDPGSSPIDYDEQTRAFCFDPGGGQAPGSGLKYRKRWGWLDMAVQASGTDCTLAISYKVDDDTNWTDYNNIAISPADAFPDLPVQLPFGFSSTKMLRKRINLHRIRPGFKLQFRYRDNASYARIKVIQSLVTAYPHPLRFG